LFHHLAKPELSNDQYPLLERLFMPDYYGNNDPNNKDSQLSAPFTRQGDTRVNVALQLASLGQGPPPSCPSPSSLPSRPQKQQGRNW
jgi:hypothetical protein